jgi:hypothetical protein
MGPTTAVIEIEGACTPPPPLLAAPGDTCPTRWAPCVAVVQGCRLLLLSAPAVAAEEGWHWTGWCSPKSLRKRSTCHHIAHQVVSLEEHLVLRLRVVVSHITHAITHQVVVPYRPPALISRVVHSYMGPSTGPTPPPRTRPGCRLRQQQQPSPPPFPDRGRVA